MAEKIKKDIMGAATMASQGVEATLAAMAEWFDPETRALMTSNFDRVAKLGIQLEYIAEQCKDEEFILGGLDLESSLTAMLGQAEFISGVASGAQAVLWRVMSLMDEFIMLTVEIIRRAADENGWEVLTDNELKDRLDKRMATTATPPDASNAAPKETPAAGVEEKT